VKVRRRRLPRRSGEELIMGPFQSPVRRAVVLPALAAAALAVVLSAAGRTAPGARSDDPRFDKLASLVEQKMKELNVPGVALGVIAGDQTSVRGFGVINADHPLPVDADTLFQIGSISKTFTGTAIMRLVEMGKVDLRAPIRRYVPDFRVKDEQASREATVWHLLTHTGGWEGDVFEDVGAGDDALAKYVAGMATVEQIAPIGAVWSYNNAGFAVAGRIIEVVTAKPYEAALQELVLDPIGLKRTFIFPGDVMTMRFASGHGVEDKGPVVQRPWPIGRYAHSMGGVIATAPDLLAYARFHMGDGTGANSARVLARRTLDDMHRAQLTKQGSDEEMALTWHVATIDGARQISHGGATVGQQAFLGMIPARKFAITTLTNSARGSRLYRDVVRLALSEYLGLRDTDPTPLAAQPDPAPYIGRYSRPFADVVIALENGRLAAQAIPKRGFPNAQAPVPPPGPKTPIAFHGPDRVIVTEGPQSGGLMQFVRGPDGRVGWVRAGSRIHRRTAQ
jgi:CubicO group peptidase (beta-lactamase class C family)